MMNIRDITKKFMEENGYDGLFLDGTCACALYDLMPCEEPSMDCKPGYRLDGCTEECGHGCAFHVYEEKP